MNMPALEDLQTKLAFLERANTELSDEVYRQAQELDALRTRLNDLARRVEEGALMGGTPSTQEERPPHY